MSTSACLALEIPSVPLVQFAMKVSGLELAQPRLRVKLGRSVIRFRHRR